MAARIKYTDEQKARALVALQANKGNASKTAQQVGVPEQTLRNWSEDPSDAVRFLMADVRRSLSDRVRDLQHRLLDWVPRKLSKANLAQVVVALEKLVDIEERIGGERRQVRGDVNISINVPVTEDERLAAMAAMLAKAEQIKNQKLLEGEAAAPAPAPVVDAEYAPAPPPEGVPGNT